MKTYKKWNKKGYYVKAGETHKKRSKKGKPLFSKSQVEEKEFSTNYTTSEYDNYIFQDITPYDLGFDW